MLWSPKSICLTARRQPSGTTVPAMVQHDMQKVAADHLAAVMRTNLAEYLEKGLVK